MWVEGQLVMMGLMGGVGPSTAVSVTVTAGRLCIACTS